MHNKVSRKEALAALGALRASSTPWDGQGVAPRLRHYRGEPWEPAGRFASADRAVGQ